MIVPCSDNSLDTSVFKALATGCEAAYGKIIHMMYGGLKEYLKRIVGDPMVAEEVLQDVFITVWVKKEMFNDIENPRSWIFRVATNRAFDHLKKAARENNLLQLFANLQPSLQSSGIEALICKESASILYKAVQQLPRQQQRVYKLSREEGLSTKDIAILLKLSQSTVKNHLLQALKGIRQYFNNSMLLLVICNYF